MRAHTGRLHTAYEPFSARWCPLLGAGRQGWGGARPLRVPLVLSGRDQGASGPSGIDPGAWQIPGVGGHVDTGYPWTQALGLGFPSKIGFPDLTSESTAPQVNLASQIFKKVTVKYIPCNIGEIFILIFTVLSETPVEMGVPIFVWLIGFISFLQPVFQVHHSDL